MPLSALSIQLSVFSFLLISEQNVKVSDTTTADCSNAAGYIKSIKYVV